MFKRYIIASTLAVLSTALSAQPVLTFKSDVVNVGELSFQQPRSITYEFTNTGTAPLLLTAVKPSCGCTSVEWPNSPIAPNQSARITATYDARMLGYFQKELEVHSNASAEPTYLTLQGRVVAAATDVEGDFPVDMGDVRLSTDSIIFDNVNRGDRPETSILVLNNTRKNIRPQLMHLPSYLTATYHPETLAGGRVGRIALRLNSEKMKSYGLNETTVYLSRQPGDKVTAENQLSVKAMLLPDFRHLSETDLQTAPLIVLSAENLDFSSAVGQKKNASQVITIGNAGERNLHISSVQLEGRALNISLSDRTIRPGKKAKLKVTLLTSHVKADDPEPRILLITNDPTHPKVVININNTH